MSNKIVANKSLFKAGASGQKIQHLEFIMEVQMDKLTFLDQ